MSGGEIIKLLLAKLLLGQHNILLLDKPGNFLDLPAIVALEKMISDYAGTVLFISHDKRLIGIAEIVYEIVDGQIICQKNKLT